MGQNESTPCMKAFYNAYNTGATDDSCNPAVLNAPVLEVGEFSGQLRAVFGGGVFGGGIGGGVSGGYDCGVSGGSISGGYDALQDYGDSLFSKSKEKLIRDIAREIFAVLKIEGNQFAKTAPLAKVVAALDKHVPNPRKG